MTSRAAGKPARRIGNYLLGRRLGAGGMAAVFAARQQLFSGSPDASRRGPGFGRLVALKVMSTALLGDPAYEQLFLREAGISARLEHKNAVRVYEVGEADGTLFIAMELVHGVSLRAIAEAGPVPARLAARVLFDLSAALHAAHELTDEHGEPLSLVHQDVTPHNAMITYQGVVKLLDFGVARLGATDASRTDTIRGKPGYLAPEQIAGARVDRRTDVFALGILLYELCTGRQLFVRPTLIEMYMAVSEGRTDDVVPGPHLPAPLCAVCRKALDRDKDRRYHDARAFGEELARAAAEIDLALPDEDELGAWVRQLKPPAHSPAELEREIVEATGAAEGGGATSAEIAQLPTQEAPAAPSTDSGVRSKSGGDATLADADPHAPDAGARPPARRWSLLLLPLAAAVGAAALVFARAPAGRRPRAATAPLAGPRATTELSSAPVSTPTAAAPTAAAPTAEAPTAAAPTAEAPTAEPAPVSARPRSSSHAPVATHAAASQSAEPPAASATAAAESNQPTRVAVRSNPYGSLFIDGRPVGSTPQRIDVEPGDHTIVVKLADGRQQSAVVHVSEGESKFVPINF